MYVYNSYKLTLFTLPSAFYAITYNNKKKCAKFALFSNFIPIFAAEPGIRYRDDEEKNFCVAIKS